MKRLAPLVLALLAVPAAAQITHRGVSAHGRVTQTISHVDPWEDGGTGAGADGMRDVLTRVEVAGGADGEATTTSYLLLFGPWGHHLYAWDEERVRPGMPDTTHLRTTTRALDLDADGTKEIVLVERTVTSRVELDDTGRPADEPGPYFADAGVSLRFLAREAGALVEHPLEAEAAAPQVKELLQADLSGPVNAWVQLAAADVDFLRERYEAARYRYGVVREWAESQLTAKEILALSPRQPMLSSSPDEPLVLWLAATRRIGALPRWYQRR